jgi:response regulator RpfG family c-di-GMP phosphodiesterase
MSALLPFLHWQMGDLNDPDTVCRNLETRVHLVRMHRFARYLAEEAARRPELINVIDENYLHTLECCVPLQDLGKVGCPNTSCSTPTSWAVTIAS